MLFSLMTYWKINTQTWCVHQDYIKLIQIQPHSSCLWLLICQQKTFIVKRGEILGFLEPTNINSNGLITETVYETVFF